MSEGGETGFFRAIGRIFRHRASGDEAPRQDGSRARPADWGKTINMRARLLEERKIERRGGVDYYQGRRIIHRDSPIDGGVYLGEGGREAIVVDSNKNHLLRGLYDKVLQRINVDGVLQRDFALDTVFNVVAEAMPSHDEVAISQLLARLGVARDGKISIDHFIAEGIGVCRHHALVCGVLLEMLQRGGVLRGKVSVDRNTAYSEGHAWCRYTTSGGEVYVLDVAQNFIGTLDEARQQGKWVYERPEDY